MTVPANRFKVCGFYNSNFNRFSLVYNEFANFHVRRLVAHKMVFESRLISFASEWVEEPLER